MVELKIIRGSDNGTDTIDSELHIDWQSASMPPATDDVSTPP